MKNENKDKHIYIHWGMTAFVVIAAVTALVFMFINIETVLSGVEGVIGILMPIIYGAVMAYLLSPIYNIVYNFVSKKIEKKRQEAPAVKRNEKFLKKTEKAPDRAGKFCATIVSVVVLCAVAIGLISMMIPELYKSVVNVINSAPENINNFSAWLNNTLSGDYEYKDEILAVYDSGIEFLQSFIDNTLKPNLDKIITQVYTGVRSVAVWIYNILIGVIVMIYLLNIKDTLIPQVKKLIFTVLPTAWARKAVDELKFINGIFGGFIIGKIVDSLIIGAMCFVILSVIDMPYTLLVSVIVGVTNVIPFFGPFIGAVPSFILIVLADPKMGLYFLVIILLLQQFDGNILGPKILGDKTGIPSFWVLFSIILFGGLFGFIGMIIAVPTWAVLLSLVREISSSVLKKKGLSDKTSDYK